ncbi:MAG: protein kinase, partial [Oligoflexales bacterium]|nr:protein kinase [Oligoflexales bacterium]
MHDITGFEIHETIHKSSNSLVYRCTKKADGSRAIIKILNQEYPTNQEVESFTKEFETAKYLSKIDKVITIHNLIDVAHTKAIIMEDINGQSLDRILASRHLDLNLFLKIAISTAEGIGKIHKCNVIHRDIKPHNIIYNIDTGELRLIDFSLASMLNRESQRFISPGLLEGTLLYISPEQTGRMNRTIDYRSDYYSLGVTFYELLTGRVPFSSSDPMEIVHFHIAKKPTPLSELNLEIPQAISDIIMKLLAKNAEERYQSIRGLIYDLNWVLSAINENRSHDTFVIGENDLSEQFIIPEKLYGRKSEKNILIETFTRVAGGNSEVLFVGGASGIGKTSLINEIHRPLTEKRGYFISGKFDKFKKNIPYFAIIQAFSEFCCIILSEPKKVQDIWKEKILRAIKKNGRVITDVIPMIKHLIGDQPEVAVLDPTEARNRFNYVFQE